MTNEQNPLTLEERVAIFSKEYLSINDIMRLFDINYNTASQMIREIKRKHDRLHTQGRVHIQDYIDYYSLDVARYTNTVQLQ